MVNAVFATLVAFSLFGAIFSCIWIDFAEFYEAAQHEALLDELWGADE